MAATHIQGLTPAELASAKDLVVTIHSATADAAELDAALRTRLQRVTVAELSAATELAKATTVNDEKLASTLADVLAERVIALGTAPLPSFEWILINASPAHEAGLAGVLAARSGAPPIQWRTSSRCCLGYVIP